MGVKKTKQKEQQQKATCIARISCYITWSRESPRELNIALNVRYIEAGDTKPILTSIWRNVYKS